MVRKTREAALIGLLAALITVTGILKIPSFIPGTEFQLSAPVAVAICSVFGFRVYILSGIVSSFVSFFIGLQNVLNIAVAMVFRVAAGGAIALLGNMFIVVILAGPLGTFLARLLLSLITQTDVWLLTAAAVPGMIFTAVTVFPLYILVRSITKRSGFVDFIVPKRTILRRKGEISSDLQC